MIRSIINVIMLACALSVMAGCVASRPESGELPYQGPLVRDNGDVVVPPSWEEAP